MASEDVVYHSKTKLILLILGSVMFVVVGNWFVSSGASTLQVIGWLSIVFFGACGLYAVARVVRPTPAVIVSAQGIVDNATANSAGLVPWSEIPVVLKHWLSLRKGSAFRRRRYRPRAIKCALPHVMITGVSYIRSACYRLMGMEIVRSARFDFTTVTRAN